MDRPVILAAGRRTWYWLDAELTCSLQRLQTHLVRNQMPVRLAAHVVALRTP